MLRNNARYKELDALRGIAAISVALFHYTFGFDSMAGILTPDKFYLKYGYLGVQLFFIISGFVIFMTLDKTKKSTDFIVSRLSRLYPAYWTAIIITISVTSLISILTHESLYTYNLKQVLVNFSMIGNLFNIKSIDMSFWTLTVELRFYGIMWLLFVTQSMKYIKHICCFWLLIFIIHLTTDIVPFEKLINRILIVNYAPLFVAGIGFYLTKKDTKNIFNHFLILLSFMTQCFMNYVNHEALIVNIIIALIFVSFYLFVYNKLKFLSNKILLFLGTISYSFYLIHQNIGCTLILVLKKIIDSQWFYIPITLSVVIVIAYFMNTIIEIPAMVGIRKYYKNMNFRKH